MRIVLSCMMIAFASVFASNALATINEAQEHHAEQYCKTVPEYCK